MMRGRVCPLSLMVFDRYDEAMNPPCPFAIDEPSAVDEIADLLLEHVEAALSYHSKHQ